MGRSLKWLMVHKVMFSMLGKHLSTQENNEKICAPQIYGQKAFSYFYLATEPDKPQMYWR